MLYKYKTKLEQQEVIEAENMVSLPVLIYYVTKKCLS